MTGTKNPIHGIQRRKFYQKTWFTEIIAAGPPVIAAGFAAADAYPAGRYGWLTLSLIWFVAAQVVKIYNSSQKEREAEAKLNHDGLLAATHVLYAVVHETLLREDSTDPGLRATVHRVEPPVDDPESILQVIPYVGGSGGGEGRLFPIRAGITGCAIRERMLYAMDRQSSSEDEYRKELVSEWHYTSADAKKATMDRFSAIAAPVLDRTGQHVIAVVYLDASRKGAFSNDIQQLVLDSCIGISKYVGERYV